MGSKDNQNPFEPGTSDLDQLDSSLRRLATQTQPRPGFVAALRGEIDRRAAQTSRRARPAWLRPFLAQAGLLLLLAGLVGMAFLLTPRPQRPDRLLPGQATGQPAPAELPAGALALLGKGQVTVLDTAPDGRLAVGSTAGVCVYNPGLSVDWCRWLGRVTGIKFDPGGNFLAAALSAPLDQPDSPIQVLDGRNGQQLAERKFKGHWFLGFDAPLAWDPGGAPRIAVAEDGGTVSAWDFRADRIAWGPVEMPGPVSDSTSRLINALDWARGPAGESLLALGGSQGLTLLDGDTGAIKQQYGATSLDPVLAIANVNTLSFAPDDGMGGPGRHLAVDLTVLEMQGWTATGASVFSGPSITTRLVWAPATGQLLSMRLAAGSLDGRIYIFKPFSEETHGQPQATLPASAYSPLSWSADGASLFYQGADGMLAESAGSGSSTLPLDYTYLPQALAWPEPETILSLGRRSINRWDAARRSLGSVSLVSFPDTPSLLALSADGKLAAYATPEENAVIVWDTAANQMRAHASVPVEEKTRIQAAAFSGDSARLATATRKGGLAVWDAHTGRLIREIGPLHGANQVDALAMSPAGLTLAVAWMDSANSTARVDLWDVEHGAQIASIPSGNTIAKLAWSPDGSLVAAAGGYSALIIDAANSQLLQNLGPEIDPQTFGTDHFQPGSFSALAFSPDSKYLVTGGKLVTVWDVTGGPPLRTFAGHTDQVSALAFRSDGKMLASGSSDGTILLWDLGAGSIPAPDYPTATPIPPGESFTPSPAGTATATPLAPTPQATETSQPAAGGTATGRIIYGYGSHAPATGVPIQQGTAADNQSPNFVVAGRCGWFLAGHA